MASGVRASGGLFLVIVLSAVLVVLLGSEDASRSLAGVQEVADNLREVGVAGQPLDRRQAQAAVEALHALTESPKSIETHLVELRGITAAAAGWADKAATPSLELSVAVAIRSAAGQLRRYASHPSPACLDMARTQLATARDLLDGRATPSLGELDGLRDRLYNLERSHEERYHDLSEDIDSGPG